MIKLNIISEGFTTKYAISNFQYLNANWIIDNRSAQNKITLFKSNIED